MMLYRGIVVSRRCDGKKSQERGTEFLGMHIMEPV